MEDSDIGGAEVNIPGRGSGGVGVDGKGDPIRGIVGILSKCSGTGWGFIFTCGYLALCLSKWTFRFPLVVKRFPQMLHLKGLSPGNEKTKWVKSNLTTHLFIQYMRQEHSKPFIHETNNILFSNSIKTRNFYISLQNATSKKPAIKIKDFFMSVL